jgi:hypothetical protein
MTKEGDWESRRQPLLNGLAAWSVPEGTDRSSAQCVTACSFEQTV